jgi:DNA-binding response OmpR family regulator
MVHRILVAEDEPVVAFDLCDTVEEAGYLVAGPFSGVSSASEAFESAAPDLAILDTSIEDGEILDLARKMDERNVPIIFYSSCQNTDDLQAQFPAAMTVIKPCPPADMLGAVNGLIEAPRAKA